jgi:hypothetical protein
MGNQRKHKRSGNSTLRYLNSSAQGVPVLRAGGETYLWMPATTGGGNVWRHVLTIGTSPGTARKRIALKAGNLTKAESQPTRTSEKDSAATGNLVLRTSESLTNKQNRLL